LQNTTTYSTEQESYWSAIQAEVSPQCFVQPTCAAEVAAIVRLAERTDCSFAVRSGGHAAFTGASSIPNGITIDLRLLNEVTISGDRTTTRVGAGNVWLDVYEKLVPEGLAVIGGRVSGIGVGGLTLGGGISFLSGRHGWACDGVRNYELVSASGDILDVNYTSYPDLYWALRGGGNNFGIVTRFDLETFPQGQMWGGTFATPITVRVIHEWRKRWTPADPSLTTSRPMLRCRTRWWSLATTGHKIQMGSLGSLMCTSRA
jgi:FAD/FMN-containing dehydrogenase